VWNWASVWLFCQLILNLFWLSRTNISFDFCRHWYSIHYRGEMLPGLYFRISCFCAVISEWQLNSGLTNCLNCVICFFTTTRCFSALFHTVFGRWTYLSRNLPTITELLFLLKQLHFLPTLTGKGVFSDLEGQLLSLLSHLGSIDNINPCVSSAVHFESSQKVTSLLLLNR